MELEKIILLETTLDHLTGEELGIALEKLNSIAEILDAVFLTGIGKKNRPSGLLQAMCRPEDEIKARDAVFRHTHALGLRRSEIERYVLPRRQASVNIRGHELQAKEHELEDRIFRRPEADSITRLADTLGVGAPALRFESREINTKK